MGHLLSHVATQRRASQLDAHAALNTFDYNRVQCNTTLIPVEEIVRELLGREPLEEMYGMLLDIRPDLCERPGGAARDPTPSPPRCGPRPSLPHTSEDPAADESRPVRSLRLHVPPLASSAAAVVRGKNSFAESAGPRGRRKLPVVQHAKPHMQDRTPYDIKVEAGSDGIVLPVSCPERGHGIRLP